MIVLGFHIIPWLYLKRIKLYSSFSSMFWALLLFHSDFCHFFLKLEKQFDSLSQVAAIVHNDFYHLSQEILGLAFQVCMPNLLLLVIIIDHEFCLCMLVCSCLKMQICHMYKLFILYLPCIKLCCIVILYSIQSLKFVSFWVWYQGMPQDLHWRKPCLFQSDNSAFSFYNPQMKQTASFRPQIPEYRNFTGLQHT